MRNERLIDKVTLNGINYRIYEGEITVSTGEAWPTNSKNHNNKRLCYGSMIFEENLTDFISKYRVLERLLPGKEFFFYNDGTIDLGKEITTYVWRCK